MASVELKLIDYNKKLKLFKSNRGEHLYSKFCGFYLALLIHCKGKKLHGGVKFKREKDMAMVCCHQCYVASYTFFTDEVKHRKQDKKSHQIGNKIHSYCVIIIV